MITSSLWNWQDEARWIASIMNKLYTPCASEKARAREASPTACIIDSPNVKSAEKGGLASTAICAGEADQGARSWSCPGAIPTPWLAAARHRVTAAAVQDRDGGLACGWLTSFGLFPGLGKLFADSCLSGAGQHHRALAGCLPRSRDRDREAIRSGEGLRRPIQATTGWSNRIHRLAKTPLRAVLAKDWDNLNATRSPSWKLASIRMLRKLCNPP